MWRSKWAASMEVLATNIVVIFRAAWPRSCLGRGSTGASSVQVSLSRRDPRGARSRNLHLHSTVLHLRGCCARLHVRSTEERSTRSQTQTSRRGERCRWWQHWWFTVRYPEMATALHGFRCSFHRCEERWLQERRRGREAAERNARQVRSKGLQARAKLRT